MGTCGRGNGAEGVYQAFAHAIDRDGLDIRLAAVGCFGACSQEPLVNIALPGQPLVMLRRVQATDVERILADVDLQSHHARPGVVQDRGMGPRDRRTCGTGTAYPELPLVDRGPVLQRPEEDRAAQLRADLTRTTSRNTSRVGGYQALYKVLIDGRPESVIEQIKAAKLRGRGGAGYPDRAQVGVPAPRPRPTRSTSSAMPTKAIPART